MTLPGFNLAMRLGAGALRVWMITGILLRVTRLRDRWDPFALVFYTTPWPVIAAGFVLLGLHSYRLGKRHAVVRYCVLTCAALFTWAAMSWYDAKPSASATPPLRVVLWNVARPEWRLPKQVSWLRRQDADIISLAEAETKETATSDRWHQLFPEYVACSSRGNLVCLIRGELLEHKSGRLAPSSHFARLRVRTRGRELTILQVDLWAHELASRRPPLTRLAELVAETKGPLLVLGDFNTPRESAHLDPLRGKLTNAFEQSGRGIAETWPLFAPALSLDQIWSSSALRPVSCRAGWIPLSDHRPVVAEFEFGQ